MIWISGKTFITVRKICVGPLSTFIYFDVVITLKDIYASRFGQELFRGFDLEIRDHENIVIRGLNGSGKSSLLELISGNLPPRKGIIEYDFIDRSLSWEEQYDLRKKMIRLVRSKSLYEITNQHELFYQQRYYNIDDDRSPTVREFLGDTYRRFEEAQFPNSFDLKNLLDIDLIKLSNGQVRKAVILKHLLKDIPKLLLLDYPFEGLDRTSRSEFNEFLSFFCRAFNVQLVLVDHHDTLPDCINTEITLKDFNIHEKRARRVNNYHPHEFDKPEEASGDPIVEFKDVTIRYGSKAIVRDLTWTVRRGERWALTGKNGAGKTTLFSLIYADHPLAYSQNVTLFGRRRGTGESIWDIKKRITYLGPEQLHFLDSATARMTGQSYLSTGEKKRSQSDLLQFFDLEDLITKEVGFLSSGELQLLALIKAFDSERELILLDEPFQFLDDEKKALVNQYLDRHLDRNRTLILISHHEADLRGWTNHRKHLE
jgi:molybdate transport system ATP-binding protein